MGTASTRCLETIGSSRIPSVWSRFCRGRSCFMQVIVDSGIFIQLDLARMMSYFALNIGLDVFTFFRSQGEAGASSPDHKLQMLNSSFFIDPSGRRTSRYSSRYSSRPYSAHLLQLFRRGYFCSCLNRMHIQAASENDRRLRAPNRGPEKRPRHEPTNERPGA